MSDLKLRGVITEETSGGGIWFLITEGTHSGQEICFPRSQISVVELDEGQEIEIPEWLAEEKNLW